MSEEEAEEEMKMFEEIRKVGGFSNETLINGVKDVEILLQMKDPPKPECLTNIKNKLELKLGPGFTLEEHQDTAIITGIISQ